MRRDARALGALVLSRAIGVLALLLWALPVSAQETITVAWDPSPDPDVTGYTLYAGSQSGTYTASQDVGNHTQRTMTLPPGTFYFAVQSYNAYGMSSDLTNEVSTTIAATPPPVPTWQAVFHNTTTGQLNVWNMAGLAMVSGSRLGLGSLNPEWQVRAHADMNGDGQKDLVLQHRSGYLATWIMNRDQWVETRTISPVSDPAWLLVAAADLNADGKTDLVFEHATRGILSAWLMNGTSDPRGVAITPSAVTDPSWRIVAAADMNGDGKPDFVWQHLRSGQVTTWLMNGTTMVGAGQFSVPGPGDPGWKVVGVVDVNHNGTPDLLWQHVSGYLAAWILNGFTVAGAELLTPAQSNAGWALVGGR